MKRPPNHNHDRATLDRAFRHRAGIIGTLSACQLGSIHNRTTDGRPKCAYPVVLAESSTGHELDCPAHQLELSRRRVQDGAASAAQDEVDLAAPPAFAGSVDELEQHLTKSQPTTEKDPTP